MNRESAGHRFRIHYTRKEAEALLPQVREWLRDLDEANEMLIILENRLIQLSQGGVDLGGELVDNRVITQVRSRRLWREFDQREIQIKDLERGLVDFPAIIGGKEVFLCWEQDEDEIEHWHELDGGYAGRERLD